jgi:hypothetical protein
MLLTSVAFADGTVTDPGTKVTTSSAGTRYSFACSNAWVPVGAGDVEVTSANPLNSPAGPSGWVYVCNATSLKVASGYVIGDYVAMCWAIPAGMEDVQIFRLNQYGGWEVSPTVHINGLVCTGSTLTGTFAAFVPEA